MYVCTGLVKGQHATSTPAYADQYMLYFFALDRQNLCRVSLRHSNLQWCSNRPVGLARLDKGRRLHRRRFGCDRLSSKRAAAAGGGAGATHIITASTTTTTTQRSPLHFSLLPSPPASAAIAVAPVALGPNALDPHTKQKRKMKTEDKPTKIQMQ
jgi:hypothetical protein